MYYKYEEEPGCLFLRKDESGNLWFEGRGGYQWYKDIHGVCWWPGTKVVAFQTDYTGQRWYRRLKDRDWQPCKHTTPRRGDEFGRVWAKDRQSYRDRDGVQYFKVRGKWRPKMKLRKKVSLTPDQVFVLLP